ncbi:MAG: hypothetical protein MI785_24060 [Kiloniellales bacterium]|nr:hypothetical protein [Kiloniellales bacterium]
MRTGPSKTALILFLGLFGAAAAASAQEGTGLENAGALTSLRSPSLIATEERPDGLIEAGLTAESGTTLRLAQKDGFVATAYLTHRRCGADCWTYEMAEDHMDLKLAARISFACAAGDSVEELRLVFPDGRSRQVHSAEDGRKLRRFAGTVVFQPWTPEQIRARAALALGGPWQGDKLGQGGNAQSARVTLRQDVRLEGRCVRDATLQTRSFQLDSHLAVIDTAWTLPAR